MPAAKAVVPLRLLFVTPHYWPEDFSEGVMMRELAEALVQRGHQVTMLTTFPNYPHGKVFPGYRGKVFQRETHHGVNIVRIWSLPVPRNRPLALRFLGILTWVLTACAAIPTVGVCDVVYGGAPPALYSLPAILASRLTRAKLIVGAKDILSAWVEAKGGNVFIRLAARQEFPLYMRADCVQVASKIHQRFVEHMGVPAGKIAFIPDWADPAAICPQPKQTAFRRAQHLDDKFLLLYSGSMGYSSDLETVLDAATLLVDDPDVFFLLIGDGVKCDQLKAIAAERRLPNVRFLPLQPREIYPEVLASADACMITLNKESSAISGQGKLYSIMAAERPVLAVMEPQALESQCAMTPPFGEIVPPGEPERLVEVIRRWRHDPELLATYGRNARQKLLDQFTVEICVGQFEQVFLQLLDGKTREQCEQQQAIT